MVLLVMTFRGAGETISKILESGSRCRLGYKQSDYKSYLDVSLVRGSLNDPIVFDVVYDNFKFKNRAIPQVPKLIVPCRPDLIWEEFSCDYKNPVSAFFNRITRLKEMAKQPKSLILPFEQLGTQGGLESLEDFLGLGKKLLIGDWEEPKEGEDHQVIRRYNRELKKMISLPSWYQKTR